MSVRFAALAMLLAGLALMGPRAHSAPLNLTTQFPDFTVNTLTSTFTFDGDGGELTIVGLVGGYTETAGGTSDINNNTVRNQVTSLDGGANLPEVFDLTVDLDGSGNILSGSFVLDGVVTFLGGAGFPAALNLNGVDYNGFNHSSGHLLSGDLSAIGWADKAGSSGAVIEFLFNGAGGLIAEGPLAENTGTPYSGGGMILDITSTSLSNEQFENGAFLTQSWNGTLGTGNVFVPVPAAVWLFGSALLALVGVRSRRERT